MRCEKIASKMSVHRDARWVVTQIYCSNTDTPNPTKAPSPIHLNSRMSTVIAHPLYLLCVYIQEKGTPARAPQGWRGERLQIYNKLNIEFFARLPLGVSGRLSHGIGGIVIHSVHPHVNLLCELSKDVRPMDLQGGVVL